MPQQACEFTGLGFSLNPVKTSQTFILSVELHDFSHGYWAGFKHIELVELTHDEMSGYL